MAQGQYLESSAKNTVIRGSVRMMKIDVQYGIEELLHLRQETPTFNENF